MPHRGGRLFGHHSATSSLPRRVISRRSLARVSSGAKTLEAKIFSTLFVKSRYLTLSNSFDLFDQALAHGPWLSLVSRNRCQARPGPALANALAKPFAAFSHPPPRTVRSDQRVCVLQLGFFKHRDEPCACCVDHLFRDAAGL